MDKLLANPRSQVVGLSKEQVNSLKGVFAVIVLLHHLYQSTVFVSNRYLGAILQALGFLQSVFSFSCRDMDYNYPIVLKKRLT